jgi:hypothetical protein
VLLAKAETVELFATEALPQALLRVGHVLAQVAGGLQEGGGGGEKGGWPREPGERATGAGHSARRPCHRRDWVRQALCACASTRQGPVRSCRTPGAVRGCWVTGIRDLQARKTVRQCARVLCLSLDYTIT